MNKISRQTIVIIVILTAALLSVFLLQKKTNASVNLVSEQTALSLLSENANQVREVLDNQLNNIWDRMEMVNSALSAIGDVSEERAVSYLKTSLPDASRVELVSAEGAYLSQDGKTGFLKYSEELAPLFLEDQRVCMLSQQGQQDNLMFGMPIRPVRAGQTEIRYLLAYFELDTFMDLLSIESFSGSGQIRVINPEGLVILYTDNLDEDKRSYYFFKFYESAKYVESQGISDFESFRRSLLGGENHAIHLITDQGENRIVSYAKVNGIDWFVTITVDYDSVLGELDNSIRTIGTASIAATMIVVLTAVLLVALISINIRRVRTEKQQLEELNQSLEKARNVAEDALKIAENANKSKSNFLANMSHDIRTPMNAIVGFSVLLSKEAENPEKVREYTEKIETSSRQLLGLINDVLDMSRIESGKTNLSLSDESLTDIIEGLDTMIRPQMHAKGHRFDVEVNHVVHDAVVADRVRLNQICMNLLSNAVKYTPDNGHIRFLVTETSTSGSTAYYEFIVQDNGYGMSQAFVENIFESFTREENSRTSKIQGTGLGMAITKSLVDLMGGTISVFSEKGRGSVFTVCLPLQISQPHGAEANAARMAEDTGSAHTESILAGKHILAAEDNELNAEILFTMLQLQGAVCEICEDGAQAVQTFCSSPPGRYDLILMDVQMPVMNGYEATRAIRSSGHENAADIPIIAMTANAFAEDVQDALNAGMDAHVSKPLDMHLLEETIRRILSEREGRSLSLPGSPGPG